MSQSLDAFYAGLFREHIDTGGFLAEHWVARFRELLPDLDTIAEIEQRLEAHLDALVLGGRRSLAVAHDFVAGEPGERHIVARLACRVHDAGLLRAVLDALAVAEPPARAAVARALAWELPADWQDSLVRRLPQAEPHLLAVLAEVCGVRRAPAAEGLLAVWSRADVYGRERLAWALGRVGNIDTCTALFEAARDEPEPARAAAARALLRLGAGSRALALVAPPTNEALFALGLAGDATAIATLAQHRQRPAAVIALGLLGDARAVEPLLALLPDPAVGAAASWALRLLTGLAPFETVFVPEDVEPEQLFPRERGRFLKGEPPKRASGRPFGVELQRLARDPERWRALWKPPMLAKGTRLRAGAAATPGALALPLLEPGWPQELRRLAVDELAIRYRLIAPFEADEQIFTQRRAIPALRSQCERLTPRT